jgi:hypothetical protein
MENYRLRTQNAKIVLIFQLEMPQIPFNLFGPSAQINQLFGIFLKKSSSHVHCPWLQFRNKRHVKKKIPFSFDAHIVNWLYAASTHFTSKAEALYK